MERLEVKLQPKYGIDCLARNETSVSRVDECIWRAFPILQNLNLR